MTLDVLQFLCIILISFLRKCLYFMLLFFYSFIYFCSFAYQAEICVLLGKLGENPYIYQKGDKSLKDAYKDFHFELLPSCND